MFTPLFDGKFGFFDRFTMEKWPIFRNDRISNVYIDPFDSSEREAPDRMWRATCSRRSATGERHKTVPNARARHHRRLISGFKTGTMVLFSERRRSV